MSSRRINRKAKYVACVFSLFVIPSFYFGTRVDRVITEEDQQYILKIVGERPDPRSAENLTYEEQIQFIRRVQSRVLQVAAEDRGIPYGRSRDPKSLFEAGAGLCFDRSWVIEKSLIANGFDVRHVAVYSVSGRKIPWTALLVPGNWSHALSEVRTKRGWVVVASNQEWLSIDELGQPVSLATVTEVGAPAMKWDESLPAPHPAILDGECVFVFGLYSRHGKFFPPYVPLPDIHWGDVLFNLSGD